MSLKWCDCPEWRGTMENIPETITFDRHEYYMNLRDYHERKHCPWCGLTLEDV